MATVNKIEFKCESIATNNVYKPPLPGRPGSGKFHNRGSGKLFPSTQQNKLFKESNHESKSDVAANHLALVLHPESKTECNVSQCSMPKSRPGYNNRRTQSGKVRKDATQTSLRQRPVSAGNRLIKDNHRTCSSRPAVIDLGNKMIADLFTIEKQKLLALPDPRDYNNQNVCPDIPPMHFSRPSSAKYSDFESIESCPCKESATSQDRKGLMPSVYGLQRQRQVYGSAPESSSNNRCFDQYPYKISQEPEHLSIEYVNKYRDIPATLEPLLPWLQNDVPEEVLGVNPVGCLVFLAPTDWSELPEVPDAQAVEDDLPFIKDVTAPKRWNPKKYPYYVNKKPLDEWVCKHGPEAPADKDISMHTIYRHTLRLPRMRTADIVKNEITDLENLLKGVGSKESDCSVVNYQSEISSFQNMLNDTLEMVPDRLKNPPPASPKDRFGLIKMCADHDAIIKEIEERVKECRIELADLELEMGIETARQHFRQRSSSVL